VRFFFHSSLDSSPDGRIFLSVDRSLFSINPGRPFIKDLLANPVLLWSVVGGMISVVLRKSCVVLHLTCILILNITAIYIPGFNTNVFYQSGIGWEWGIVVGMSAVFLVGCELWKIARRPLFKRWTPSVISLIPDTEHSEKASSRT